MRKRAQLVLVGALVLGIAFVGVALLVNTVVFTENLATRQDGTSEREAVQYRDTSTDAVAGFIVQVNGANHTSRDALRSNLSDAVATWSRTAAAGGIARGALAETTLVDTTNGTLIHQTNASRNLTAGGTRTGDGNWTLVDAERTRRFRLTVSDGDLYQSSADGTLSSSQLDSVSDEAFHVALIDADGSTSRVYLFEDDGGTVRVFVENSSGYDGANDAGCQTNEALVTVDLVAGTVDGQECRALGVYDPETAHTVEYRNATLGGTDRAAGTYELLAEASSVPSDTYHDADSGDSPFARPVIYAATVRVEYQADALHYRSRVEVVP